MKKDNWEERFDKRFWYTKRNGIRINDDVGASRFAKEEDIKSFIRQEYSLLLKDLAGKVEEMKKGINVIALRNPTFPYQERDSKTAYNMAISDLLKLIKEHKV